jgi:hypothetical protein
MRILDNRCDMGSEPFLHKIDNLEVSMLTMDSAGYDNKTRSEYGLLALELLSFDVYGRVEAR